MSRTNALKTMRFSSELRTTLNLCHRSNRCSPARYAAAYQTSLLYLAQSNLNYPPALQALGLRQGQTLLERRNALGLEAYHSDPSPAEKDFQDFLATSSRKSLKSNWIWRIGQHCLDRSLEGWYGFFVTLTVDPSKVPDSQSMWQEGREFRKYIRRLARISSKACGQPRAIHNGASCADFVHHVGVIEHGKSRHHHHMHLLIWMRDIPDSWKQCPNRGIRAPEHRTNDWCKPMSTYWPNSLPGLGRAKFFRHEGDQWSRLGFCLPYDRKKKAVVRIHGPEKAGLYIAKYMDKEDKSWLHRVKATRNLGTIRLKAVLMRMHIRKLEALTWRPEKYSTNISLQTIHTVPSALLRLMAKQELFCRQWVSGSLDYPMLLSQKCDAFAKMLTSVRSGAKIKRMRSREFYEWVTAHLPASKGYCEKRLLRAAHSLAVDFPPDKSRPVQHIGIT